MNHQLYNRCPHTDHILKDWEFSEKFWISEESILYNKQWKPLNYDSNYFLEEYKKIYKKNYIEDEAHIRFLSRRRLNHLSKFINSTNKNLLEIGCATGFFLDEAKKIFNEVEGIEISDYAVNYGKKKLNLNIQKIDLREFINKNNKKYNIIASFYVIEHFVEQREIFKFISNSLEKNGLWICAIPSTYGPLFEFSKEKWIETHPVDHYVDYNPQALRKILNIYGLKLLKIFPASYHKDRIKGILKKIPDSIYRKYCDLVGYGDTIEFIAVK